MTCKLCGKTKKEHFKKDGEYYCTKYGKKKFVLPNACEVCGVETHKFPDGQYICSDCRYNQEREDAFSGDDDE